MKYIIASSLLLSLYSCASASDQPKSSIIKNLLPHAIILRINNKHDVLLEPKHYLFIPDNAQEIHIMPATERAKRKRASSSEEEPCLQQ